MHRLIPEWEVSGAAWWKTQVDEGVERDGEMGEIRAIVIELVK